MTLYFDRVPSPIGEVLLVSDGRSLVALEFEDHEGRMRRQLSPRYGDATLKSAHDPQGFSSRLRAYFTGRLEALDDIPVDGGGTPFQMRVWRMLRTIPVGSTASYGELAARLGKPQACRAVGLANGRNPISIVVPCHRVIGTDGSLTGYGGGLERKRWLLEHEGVQLQAARRRVA